MTILKTIGIDLNTHQRYKIHVNNKLIQKYFLNEWEKNLQMHGDGKLCSYVLLKNNFGREGYLSIVKSFEKRSRLTRLRVSAHSLRIEKGRHQGIPRHDRTCTRCSSGEVEDEVHFILKCKSLDSARNKLIKCIEQNCPNFKELSDQNKFIWLMNNENREILYELCTFINDNENH